MTRSKGITSPQATDPAREGSVGRRGFTIVELIVCLGVIAVLCGILLPSLRATREAAHRMSCASNQRQVGAALSVYVMANDDALPPSNALRPGTIRPWELMAARHGPASLEPVDPERGWDGLGLLVKGNYLGSSCECLHCASHRGEHPHERYASQYADREGRSQIYTNYHYSGHVRYGEVSGSQIAEARRVSLNDGHEIVLLSDGLRTQLDFNHRVGLNRMWADLSVEWVADSQNAILASLPPEPPAASSATNEQAFRNVWKFVSDPMTR